MPFEAKHMGTRRQMRALVDNAVLGRPLEISANELKLLLDLLDEQDRERYESWLKRVGI